MRHCESARGRGVNPVGADYGGGGVGLLERLVDVLQGGPDVGHNDIFAGGRDFRADLAVPFQGAVDADICGRLYFGGLVVNRRGEKHEGAGIFGERADDLFKIFRVPLSVSAIRFSLSAGESLESAE